MTKTEQELLSRINEIDTYTLAEGGGKMADLFVLERCGMWQKGLAVLKMYPELEGGGAKAGRPKKNEPAVVSMNKVAIITGRSTPTISKWIKFVMAVGKTQEDFNRWIKDAKKAAVEKWQQKLIQDNTDKKSKKVENELYLSLREQIDLNSYEDEACKADVKMLFRYFKQFEKYIRQAIMNLADGEIDKARSELEKALSRIEK